MSNHKVDLVLLNVKAVTPYKMKNAKVIFIIGLDGARKQISCQDLTECKTFFTGCEVLPASIINLHHVYSTGEDQAQPSTAPGFEYLSLAQL